MAGEWRTATVRELQAEGVLLVEDGNHGESRPRPHEFVDAGVSFVRAADMGDAGIDFRAASRINETARKRITRGIGRAGDVLLSHKGTVGKVAMVQADAPLFVCSPQTTFWRAVDTERLDPRYLHAFLRSPVFHEQLATRSGETDMAPYVSLTSQRGLSVVLPPMTEQRAIARHIGALDEKIEINRKMSETLETMARALFKSWFVDFDPVRAKAVGRETGLPKHVDELFPESFEDADYGAVPTGWRVRSLAEVLHVERGLSYKGEFLSEHGVPMVNLGCFLGGGRFSSEAVKGYAGEFKKRHTVRPGDLLIANTDITQKRHVIGSPALVPEGFNQAEILFSHHVFAARFREGHESLTDFVFFLLLQEGFRERAMGFATGTTVLALPADAVLQHLFVLPPAELIRAWLVAAQPLMSRQRRCAGESKSLAAVRDLLLPSLISGVFNTRQPALSVQS